jgi:hypothetical protein
MEGKDALPRRVKLTEQLKTKGTTMKAANNMSSSKLISIAVAAESCLGLLSPCWSADLTKGKNQTLPSNAISTQIDPNTALAPLLPQKF